MNKFWIANINCVLFSATFISQFFFNETVDISIFGAKVCPNNKKSWRGENIFVKIVSGGYDISSSTLVAIALLKCSLSLFDISMNEVVAKDEQQLIPDTFISRFFFAVKFCVILRSDKNSWNQPV